MFDGGGYLQFGDGGNLMGLCKIFLLIFFFSFKFWFFLVWGCGCDCAMCL